eukprot:1711620-Lingulodinium_polyedra.AAC.1
MPLRGCSGLLCQLPHPGGLARALGTEVGQEDIPLGHLTGLQPGSKVLCQGGHTPLGHTIITGAEEGKTAR